jgi:outer membrane receptor protein involved in Fe transport
VYQFLPDNALRGSYRVGRRKPNFTETRIGFVTANPFPPPVTLPIVTGEEDLDRETVQAFEGGYRGYFRDLGLLLDGQLFLHELKDKVQLVPDLASPVPGALTFDNRGKERGMGLEVALEWQVAGPLSLYATYTLQTFVDTSNNKTLRNRPRHKTNFGPRLQFKEGVLDGVSAFINLNWVSDIEQRDALGINHEIDDRFRLDFRIAKRFLKNRVELAIIGRNLLDGDTLEYRPALGSNFDGAFEAERMFLFNVLIELGPAPAG